MAGTDTESKVQCPTHTANSRRLCNYGFDKVLHIRIPPSDCEVDVDLITMNECLFCDTEQNSHTIQAQSLTRSQVPLSL